MSSRLESTGPRCGTRSAEPCTDHDGIRFIQVSAGQVHSCGITVDSAAYCWGDGRSGQLGNGLREVSRFPRRVLGHVRFATIGAGGAFTCARTADGQVHCWGSERAVPGWPNQPEGPVRVTLEQPATSLTVGRRHACVLDAQGKASCWGWNVDGETGTGTSGIDQSMIAVPTPVATEARFTSLSAGADLHVRSDNRGEGVVLGLERRSRPWTDRAGALRSHRCPCRAHRVPCPLPCPSESRSSRQAARTCAHWVRRGTVWCWGANTAGQAGAFSPDVPSVPTADRRCAEHRAGRLVVERRDPDLRADVGSSRVLLGRRPDQLRPRRGHDRPLTPARRGRHPVPGDQRRTDSRLRPGHGGRVRCWGDTILGALGIR